MTPAKLPKKILFRQHEIFADFLKEIDIHLADILSGRATEMFHIKDFAEKLFIHPTHLSNTIKLTTGKAPCFFFEEKLMQISREMLAANKLPIAEIARKLTYDPSNFTKFFKHFEGITPKQYREQVLMEKFAPNTETLTI
jgi:AraC family transcriptional regulator of adaptative response / methylphosphotriester-DNA alkyltransferase methyltransferase